jgi:hypothetical protein
VVTRDFEPCKPHPAPVLHICDEWGLQPGQVAVVGDDKTDMISGLRAGTAGKRHSNLIHLFIYYVAPMHIQCHDIVRVGRFPGYYYAYTKLKVMMVEFLSQCHRITSYFLISTRFAPSCHIESDTLGPVS